MNIAENKKELEKNGWALVKNVFSKEEVADLRKRIKESVSQGKAMYDWLANDALSHLVYDKRLLEIARAFLGDKLVYFGDSSYQVASATPILNGFHKDCVDRYNPDGTDWKSPYTLVRMGIYLQDHASHSEGLVVRSGSHKTMDLNVGKKVNVPSEIGDVAVWYLTTTHSGNAKRIRLTDYPVPISSESGKGLANYLYCNLPKVFFQPAEDDRIAMFIVYGVKDHHMARYMDMLKHRKFQVERWQKAIYDPAVVAKANAANLEVMDMHGELKDVKLSEVKEWDFVAKM